MVVAQLQALLEPRVTRDVEALLAELLHATGDHVLDLGRVDSYAPRALPAYFDATVRPLDSGAGSRPVNDRVATLGRVLFYDLRLSTNDKAGSAANLMRWTSARSIKETLVPPVDHRYPHMD